MIAPCRDCENKGCGAYHDICPAYAEFKEAKEFEKARRFQESEFRCYKTNIVIKTKREGNNPMGWKA